MPRHWKTPHHPCCLVQDYSEVLNVPSFMSSLEGMPSKTKLSMWVACWESSWLIKTGSTGPDSLGKGSFHNKPYQRTALFSRQSEREVINTKEQFFIPGIQPFLQHFLHIIIIDGSHHKDWKKYACAPHPPTRRDPCPPGRWVRCSSPAHPTNPSAGIQARLAGG